MDLRIDERCELIGADRSCAPETHDHRRGRSAAEIFGLRHVGHVKDGGRRLCARTHTAMLTRSIAETPRARRVTSGRRSAGSPRAE